MNRFFYNLLIILLAPALLAWMGLRARRAGGNWAVLSPRRFGYYKARRSNATPDTPPANLANGTQSSAASTHRPPAPVRPIWVHAVSLGETRAAQPLINALLEQGDTVLLTQMTATGRAAASVAFSEAIERGQLQQEWLPYDYRGSTRRFLDHYRPQMGVLIEREVWPNILAAARKRAIPMMLASARFSDHSLRQSLRMGNLMRKAYASLESVYAQTLSDAQRLEQAGANAVRVSGNFKFDVRMPELQVRRGREFATLLARNILCIASTREGEDELFIDAIRQQLQRSRANGDDLAEKVLFCLVPRHPQRFDHVAALLDAAGLSYVRRSALDDLCGTTSAAVEICRKVDVLLGDSLGEMPRYYASSALAIVAGSFMPLGGQNLIEACAIGTPVIVGPHTRNFEQAAADAIQAGAALRAPDADAALQLGLQLLEQPQRLGKMGEAGLYWVTQHAGAVERVLVGINALKKQTAGNQTP